ncbi:DegV family protein [Mycoplasmopsis felifaucium]|uniref:DegV family protein n=1 Tax=Mycoplasmopsis felifaucium TaxID=35768 RepID=UPI00296214E6|nr:DegV family protein [Mycoplasmopsis felifaucium]
MTPETLFDKFKLTSNVKTSAFNMAEANELFEELSKTYDKIIVYPISKHLSSSYRSLKLMEADFPKLRVIESVEVVQLIAFDCIWLDQQMKLDSSKIDEYISFIENNGFNKSITLIPKYNNYLVKGGRLHPAASTIAKMLRIVPLIKWENGKLLKEGVGIKFEKAVSKNIINKAVDFKASDENVIFPVLEHSGFKDEYKHKIVSEIQYTYKIAPLVCFIPPVVSMHVGPEGYALMLLVISSELADLIAEKFKEINYSA